MSDQPPPSCDTIERLTAELQLSPAAADTALGEVEGLPTAFTVLGVEPLSGMFEFRVDCDCSQSARVAELLGELSDDIVSFSLEAKHAWLSFYYLEQFEFEKLCQMVRTVARRLRDISFSDLSGCLRCGDDTGVELLLVEGHPTRACSNCLNEAVQEREAIEAELNRPNLSATIGLLFSGTIASVEWAIFWTMIDVLMQRLNVRVIWINYFTFPLLIALAGGVGWVIGWPAGKSMRRSAAIQVSPYMTIGWFLLVTGVCGEILYLAINLARHGGLFDLVVAAKLLTALFAAYTGFWICCKLFLLAAVYFFCVLSAMIRNEVEIDL